jgi:rare lipoprotein A
VGNVYEVPTFPPGSGRRAAGLIIATLVVCSCLGPTAQAHAKKKRKKATPVLVGAPELAHYGERVRIVGKLENGRRGQKVFLKRRYIGVGKEIIRSKRVKKNLKVKFFLPNRTMSATYRLIVHPGKNNQRESKAARIEVTPRLTFEIDPNDVKYRREIDMYGQLLPVVEGRTVRIQRRNFKGEWELLKKIDAGDGVYKRFWEPDYRGRRQLRIVFNGDELNAPAKRRERLWIYRRGEATWYGPGFYGNTTACGQTLRKKTLGVAHRTLDCGTKVDFLYKQRTITVRVIDRGPYGEADWDLTNATKERLHFEGRDEVGYIAH